MKMPFITAIALLLVAAPAIGQAQQQENAFPIKVQRDSYPRPEYKFPNAKVGMDYRDSTPDFPKPVEAPEGAPNVLLVLLDDVGFGCSSTFGGMVRTPTADRLAKTGLRFNNFHTTALCSPTRATLLTGRNHHSCATGIIQELAVGYPGYSGLMPKSCGTVARILAAQRLRDRILGQESQRPGQSNQCSRPIRQLAH